VFGIIGSSNQTWKRVLDVGAGSGYLTACFVLLVGPKGKVVGIETVDALVEWASQNISRDQPQLLEQGTVVIKKQDGWKGDPEFQPFDAIHVGAAAEKLPQPLVDQLKCGGRMVIPVGSQSSTQQFLQVDKSMDGNITTKNTRISNHYRRFVLPIFRFPANKCFGIFVLIVRSPSPAFASRFRGRWLKLRSLLALFA